MENGVAAEKLGRWQEAGRQQKKSPHRRPIGGGRDNEGQAAEQQAYKMEAGAGGGEATKEEPAQTANRRRGKDNEGQAAEQQAYKMEAGKKNERREGGRVFVASLYLLLYSVCLSAKLSDFYPLKITTPCKFQSQ